MTLHYELVPEDQITHDGRTLTRIRATVDLPEHGVNRELIDPGDIR
mgnify:CR=1 FL=1